MTWISVKDRLPENGGWYLVGDTTGVWIAIFGEGRFWNSGEPAPTHWQPLPEAPVSVRYWPELTVTDVNDSPVWIVTGEKKEEPKHQPPSADRKCDMCLAMGWSGENCAEPVYQAAESSHQYAEC